MVALRGAVINVNQSAISSATLPGLDNIDYLLFVNGTGGPPAGTYTASTCTYMTATTNQTKDDLILATNNQTLLLVNPPEAMGLLRETLPYYRNEADYAYPLLSGPLIDCIPDAKNVNQLINPQDNSIIEVDVFGSPRVDNNERRNIGAIQNLVTPLLSAKDKGPSGAVPLSWVPPLEPKNLTGYQICYCPTTSPQCNLDCRQSQGIPGCAQSHDINNASALSVTISGLENGNEYSFCVSGVKDGVNGPSSNVVKSTPYGQVLAPTVRSTGAPGCNSLNVSWTQPSLGGYYFLEYGIVYFPTNNPTWTSSLEATTQSITIDGPLLANTQYTVCVLAIGLGSNSVEYGAPGCTNVTTLCTVRAPMMNDVLSVSSSH